MPLRASWSVAVVAMIVAAVAVAVVAVVAVAAVAVAVVAVVVVVACTAVVAFCVSRAARQPTLGTGFGDPLCNINRPARETTF